MSNPPTAPLPHTDIRTSGWVSRLPAAWRPYALLMRLDRPIGTWLLLLPGWWTIAAASCAIGGGAITHGLYIATLFSIGAIIMRGAGCTINDMWDRDYDKQVERTRLRPLAAGTVTMQQAMVLTATLLTLGLIILLQLSPVAIGIGVASVVLVVLYPLAKRVTWYPQAVLGLTFNIGALMGWAAMTDHISQAPVMLYIGGFFWTLGYDAIYAHQDSADDGIVGIKSTARKFGERSPIYIAGFYTIMSVFHLIAGWLLAAGPLFYLLWAMSSGHFIWQLATWDKNSPQDCLKKFRSNRDYGLLVTLSFLLAFL